MTEFTIHTEATAPEASKASLAESKASFGMVPNMHAVMAEAPGLLEGYKTLHALFTQTSFNAAEQTVVWQTINVENNCTYCVPAHTGIAMHMGVDQAVTDALRNNTPLPDAKLEALRAFTLTVVRDRGHVDELGMQAFFEAGFTRRQALEVVLGYAQKIMSNYTNHLAATPLDPALSSLSWNKPETIAAE
ncbi:MAG: carboxymuconolactone decarboxylase family protein [Pseudomonadota bacterium]